jgi:catechol 2,3-dioxygenase-like lactoylglutathione lyase family enzyme
MIDQSITLDHIGWVTNDIDLFEEFWCNRLGFELIFESNLDRERALALFGLDTSGAIRRYRRESMTIEIHHLNPITGAPQEFSRFGINHIALHVDDRERFIHEINTGRDLQVPVHRHENPGGWFNLFIRDFEGNWIELRESLTGSNAKTC